LFRAGSIAKHLLLLSYDSNVVAVDKTILVELVTDGPQGLDLRKQEEPQQMSQVEIFG